MKASDFQVGDLVQDQFGQQGTVTKVGRKYLYVSCEILNTGNFVVRGWTPSYTKKVDLAGI